MRHEQDKNDVPRNVRDPGEELEEGKLFCPPCDSHELRKLMQKGICPNEMIYTKFGGKIPIFDKKFLSDVDSLFAVNANAAMETVQMLMSGPHSNCDQFPGKKLLEYVIPNFPASLDFLSHCVHTFGSDFAENAIEAGVIPILSNFIDGNAFEVSQILTGFSERLDELDHDEYVGLFEALWNTGDLRAMMNTINLLANTTVGVNIAVTLIPPITDEDLLICFFDRIFCDRFKEVESLDESCIVTILQKVHEYWSTTHEDLMMHILVFLGMFSTNPVTLSYLFTQNVIPNLIELASDGFSFKIRKRAVFVLCQLIECSDAETIEKFAAEPGVIDCLLEVLGTRGNKAIELLHALDRILEAETASDEMIAMVVESRDLLEELAGDENPDTAGAARNIISFLRTCTLM